MYTKLLKYQENCGRRYSIFKKKQTNYFFTGKITLDISRDLSARQTIYIKYQLIFSGNKRREIRMAAAAAVIGSLWVNR